MSAQRYTPIAKGIQLSRSGRVIFTLPDGTELRTYVNEQGEFVVNKYQGDGTEEGRITIYGAASNEIKIK